MLISIIIGLSIAIVMFLALNIYTINKYNDKCDELRNTIDMYEDTIVDINRLNHNHYL